MTIIAKIDEVTFLVDHGGRTFIVWEFEGDFALSLHIQQRTKEKYA